MVAPRGLLVLATLLLVAAGCRTRGEPGGGPSAAPTLLSAAAPSKLVPHEKLGLELRDAAIRADREATTRLARELATNDLGATTPELRERVQAMQVAASSVAEAEDALHAAIAVGGVVRACAECHARLGGPTRLDVALPPPPSNHTQPRMQRHAWAAEQLWSGLVFNSEPPWHAGAEVLADPALTNAELVPKKTAVFAIDTTAAAVHLAGERAQATSDVPLRAEIYGDFLSTCAGCHERTGGGALGRR